MKHILSIALIALLLVSCENEVEKNNSSGKNEKKVDQIDSLNRYMLLKNSSLYDVIGQFKKQAFSFKNGTGLITLRVYASEKDKKNYGISMLRSEFELTSFKPMFYTTVDSNMVLIKVDALESLFEPLKVEHITTPYLDKNNNEIHTSRYPFWLLEESKDSIIVIEKR